MLTRLARLLLTPVLAALAFAAPLASVAQPIPVRIVTMNVRQGIGAPSASDALATGKFLTNRVLPGAPAGTGGLNPDIVCLQELTSDADNLAFRDTYLPGYQYFRVNQVDAGGLFCGMLVRPDIQVLDRFETFIGGPRNMLRVVMRVPGSDRILSVYTAHFKAFSDASSVAQRTSNANNAGFFISNDITLGLDLDRDGTRETPSGYTVFCGDLNSNNNTDNTITGVFTNVTNQQPTGLLNLPVESLLGRTLGGNPIITTFPPSSRLDYVCTTTLLSARHSSAGNGSFTQDDLNTMGFVYFSGDDAGVRSNGDTSATTNASDHRPVVFDLLLRRSCAGDTNGDNAITFADLSAALAQFGLTGFNLTADFNADGRVTFADLSIVLAAFGTTCQ